MNREELDAKYVELTQHIETLDEQIEKAYEELDAIEDLITELEDA